MNKEKYYKRLLMVISGLCDMTGKNEEIYMIAHLASDCKNPHKDWQKEFLRIEKWLKKNKII